MIFLNSGTFGYLAVFYRPHIDKFYVFYTDIGSNGNDAWKKRHLCSVKNKYITDTDTGAKRSLHVG